MLSAMHFKIYNSLFQQKNWMRLKYCFDNDDLDIREDDGMKDMITLNSVPLSVFLFFKTIRKHRCNHRILFQEFDNKFMLQNKGAFCGRGECADMIEQYVLELLERALDDEVLELLKCHTHLVHNYKIVKRATHFSRIIGRRCLLYELIRIICRSTLVSKSSARQEGCSDEILMPWSSYISNDVDVGPQVSEFWFHEFLSWEHDVTNDSGLYIETNGIDTKEFSSWFEMSLTSASRDNENFCFDLIVRVLKEEHSHLLKLKSFINELKLVQRALHYGNEGAFRCIVATCEDVLSKSDGGSGIFHQIAIEKNSVGFEIALGVGSVIDNVKYPIDVGVLLEKDSFGLSSLHYLWFIPINTFGRRDIVDVQHHDNAAFDETLVVEKVLMCLRACENKFPNVRSHFLHAWKGVISLSLPQNHPIMLRPCSTGLMRQIVDQLAHEENRLPMEIACHYGLPWESLRVLFHEDDENYLTRVDEQTQLKLFALAACDQSDLDVIFELIVRNPATLEISAIGRRE